MKRRGSMAASRRPPQRRPDGLGPRRRHRHVAWAGCGPTPGRGGHGPSCSGAIPGTSTVSIAPSASYRGVPSAAEPPSGARVRANRQLWGGAIRTAVVADGSASDGHVCELTAEQLPLKLCGEPDGLSVQARLGVRHSACTGQSMRVVQRCHACKSLYGGRRPISEVALSARAV